LLSHGAVVLFLLWYITPRAIFGGHDQASALAAGKATPIIQSARGDAVASP
jgi:hypothetical protein